MRSTLGTDEEYSASGKKQRGKGLRPFYPLIGLVLIGAFGAIAYVLGEPLANAIANAGVLGPGGYGDNFEVFTWIIRGAIFAALVLIGALLYAVGAPKPKSYRGVNERDLDKERRARQQAELEAKKKRKKVRNEMAKQRRKEATKR